VFDLTSQGTNLFNADAKLYYGMLIADDLDGRSSPRRSSRRRASPAQGEVSGNFTHAAANQLALELNYGALPVSLTPQTSQTVSASLGKSSLQAGLSPAPRALARVVVHDLLLPRPRHRRLSRPHHYRGVHLRVDLDSRRVLARS
jgi:preprotein translocase subunit SecD